jgi:Ni/Fe-hydrogenase subunit HybB-like protein
MSKVLTCLDFDSTTQTCNAEAWVDQAGFVDYLPTVEQANTIGAIAFSSLITLAVARRLLFPPETKELT